MFRNLLKAVTVTLFLITANLAQALVVPAGLNPGDTYQLAFVTAGTRNAAFSNISTYNTFVQTEAGLNTSLTGAGVNWSVIGSTSNVDARDNALVSAPVYLLDGSTIIANDFSDMWDGSIDAPIDIDQFGLTVVTDLVHTGSLPDGTNAGTNSLGSAQNGSVGSTNQTSGAWISNGADQTSILRPFYALSEVLTVPVPEPMSGSLIAAGALVMLLRRRRR